MEFEKICKIMGEVLGVDPKEITPQSTILNDLGADSLDAYQILMKIEDEFEIQIDPGKLEHVQVVQDVVDLIIK